MVLPPGAGPSTGIYRVLSFKLLLGPVSFTCVFIHIIVLWSTWAVNAGGPMGSAGLGIDV